MQIQTRSNKYNSLGSGNTNLLVLANVAAGVLEARSDALSDLLNIGFTPSAAGTLVQFAAS
jgi:hypothetical protein